MRTLLTLGLRIFFISALGLFASTIAFGQTSEQADKVDNPIEYIKKETIGGKLDFNLKLEDKFYLFQGVAYNRKDYGIFLWGQAVKRLGIPSSKKASKLWTEIHKRDLTSPEKKALTRGFELELK